MSLSIKRRVTLDLSKRGVQVTIPFSVGDRAAYEIIFTVADGSEIVKLPVGVYAAVSVKNGADGTGVVDRCIIDHVNDAITYIPTLEALAVEGIISATLHIYDSAGAVIGAPSFALGIYESDNANTESEVAAALKANPGWNIIANTEAKAEEAAKKAREAENFARKAEAYATGKMDDVDADGYVYNNAKYYSEVAADEADNAAAEVENAKAEVDNAKAEVENAKTEANRAAEEASEAANQANSAEEWANIASGFAVGDYDIGTYGKNNAKYFSEVAKGHSDDALTRANRAKGWANGNDPFSVTPSSTNNAKYYSEQAKKYVDNLGLRVTADNVNYRYTFQLTHEGVSIGNAVIIDLPIESLVVGVAYDEDLDALRVNLKGGETVTVPLGEIIQGLASQQYVDEELDKRYTKPEVDKMVGSLKGHYAIVRDKILEIKSDTTYVQGNTLIFAY